MTLVARNILLNCGYYLLSVVAAPSLVLALERQLFGTRRTLLPVRTGGGVLLVISAIAQVWCIVLLQRSGGGTPSPLEPTKRLVTHGPYAWLRNPLNLAEVAFFVGLAAWFGSWGMLAYAVAAFGAFHLFILAHEEPRHRRSFGSEYEAYVAHVPRWLPRRGPPARP